MVIRISSELEAALIERARQQGVAPDELVSSILRERLLQRVSSYAPRDQWERTVLGLATDCGVSLPHSALSSEGLYE